MNYSDQNNTQINGQTNGHNSSRRSQNDPGSESLVNGILDLPSISSTALNSTTTTATDFSTISTASTLTLGLPEVPNHEPLEKTVEKKKKSRFSMPTVFKKKRKSKDKSNPDLS